MENLFYLILWLIIAAIFALIGKNREIGYGWSLVLCMFLGIIGIVIVLCSKKKDVEFVEIK